jgi:Lecithin retinol acyltransferase
MNWRIDNARSDSLLRAGEEPPLASHLVTPRAFYTHHGIYAGNGRVIHYSGLAYGWRRGAVEAVSLERFAHGHSIRVRRDLCRFDPRAVLERAFSRLGEHSYRILTNNCEHFCAWALRGESRSSQVERLGAIPGRIGAALRAWIERAGAIVERQATLTWSEADLSSDGRTRG